MAVVAPEPDQQARQSVTGCYTRNSARLGSQQEAHWAKQKHNQILDQQAQQSIAKKH
jgi:hypothetical protein